ncbi:glutaredoxin family protein [Micromonospora sp. DT227]|uniref:glutaredoxin family protein n=1 Tax=Micromonospora sp. DT227 TaxID=3393433 RepID=UPI003CF9DA77
MYGTGCCPDVRRSRTLLDRAYTYIDLDDDKIAAEIVRQLQRGQRRVPTPTATSWPNPPMAS